MGAWEHHVGVWVWFGRSGVHGVAFGRGTGVWWYAMRGTMERGFSSAVVVVKASPLRMGDRYHLTLDDGGFLVGAEGFAHDVAALLEGGVGVDGVDEVGHDVLVVAERAL